MLEERGRLLDTLATLLDAVNLASTEQRAAVDALVGTTSELMDRVGAQFSERVRSETGKLAEISAQVTGSAVEVASLGEAFGAAVQLFSASNDKLATQLERIEAALDKSIARGDEQLSYYVSQAREVVDLSLMSQKQIMKTCSTWPASAPTRGRGRMSEDFDAGVDSTAPTWAVFGDLMSVLLGSFVLILVSVIGMQLELSTQLETRSSSARRKPIAAKAWNRCWPARWPPAASRWSTAASASAAACYSL